MLRSFNWVWPQHSLNIVWTFFQLMLKQRCDRLTGYDLNIVSTLPENFFSKRCKNLATAWPDIVLTQSTNDANNAVFSYSRKACYPSLAERTTESCKVILPFEPVEEIQWCCHSNETFLAVLSRGTIFFPVERFSYDLEMKTREQNRNNKRTEIGRYDWFIERTQKCVAFGCLRERSGEKTSCLRTF